MSKKLCAVLVLMDKYILLVSLVKLSYKFSRLGMVLLII